MAILLSEFEHAPRHKGGYGDQLAALLKRLQHAQAALIAHRRRAIVVVEGAPGVGKGDVVRRLAGAWDPRGTAAFAIDAPSADERARHHLARFWARLPADGHIHLFCGSWYRRVLAERLDAPADKARWRRGYDEINEFEAQQTDSGTILVKLFLHASEAEQQRRLRARIEHPWQRSTVTPEDLRIVDARTDYGRAAEEMFVRTDTRWAPWTAIAADHRKHARLTALARVAEAMEKALPQVPPPPDPAITAWAHERWGAVD